MAEMNASLLERFKEAKEAVIKQELQAEVYIKRTKAGYLALFDRVTRKCIRVSYPSEMVRWLRTTTFLPRKDIK